MATASLKVIGYVRSSSFQIQVTLFEWAQQPDLLHVKPNQPTLSKLTIEPSLYQQLVEVIVFFLFFLISSVKEKALSAVNAQKHTVGDMFMCMKLHGHSKYFRHFRFTMSSVSTE